MDTESTGQVEPILVTVADAARILGLKPGDVAQILDSGAIASCYQQGRRSVSMVSLRRYADNLLRESA